MAKLIADAKTFFREVDAATMVEYSIMIAFIAVVCVGAVTALGTHLIPGFQTVVTGLGS